MNNLVPRKTNYKQPQDILNGKSPEDDLLKLAGYCWAMGGEDEKQTKGLVPVGHYKELINFWVDKWSYDKVEKM